MKKFLKTYGLPVLLILVVAVVVLNLNSVEEVDLDAQYSTPRINVPGAAAPESADSPHPVSRLEVGARYASLGDLAAEQLAAGFIKVGTFGDHWPATVTEVETGEGGISFVRRDGRKHSYTGFEGYRMQMVRLEAENGEETVIVFRSMQKG